MAQQTRRLTAWNRNMYDRRTAANIGIQKAVFAAWALLPEPYQKTPRTLERYETTAPEESADAVFLAALARVYGCELEELSPLAAERLATLIGLGADQHLLASNSFAA